jgi:bacterioferritin
MRGDDQVVEALNEILTSELTAVNQYYLDAKMLQNWGYERLAHRYRDESIGEMKDADELIERILYLDGHPNLQRLSPLRTGETAPEKVTLALELEVEAIARLNRSIALCGDRGDYGTRELLEHILEGEESFADWLETQLESIRQIGEPFYLAQQLHD